MIPLLLLMAGTIYAPIYLPIPKTPIFYFKENWEGTATSLSNHWQAVNDSGAGGVVFANTTNVIEGSQSLAVDSNFASPTPNYAQNIGSYLFTNCGTVYAFTLVKHLVLPTAGFGRAVHFIAEHVHDNHLAELDVRSIDSTHFVYSIWAGVSGHTETVSTFGPAPCTNAIWTTYTVGSGANGISEVYFTPVFNLASIIKPALGSNNYATRTDGNYTDCSMVVKYVSDLSGGNQTQDIFDRSMVSDSPIGSNPTIP